MVKVTLIKSLIASLPAQKATAASLGLRKIGDCTVQKDTPALAGQDQSDLPPCKGGKIGCNRCLMIHRNNSKVKEKRRKASEAP